MRSCIYEGTVRHRRHSPVPHTFAYPLFMMYLDLEEVPAVFEGRWLWSADRPAPAWFRRADYLGDPGRPLDAEVRREAERLTGRRPAGPIRMLTHLRYFGYVMNPVTFYYCFGEGGEHVETILAEITNTPWSERHTYGLTSADPACDPAGDPAGDPAHGPCDRQHRFEKAFHISPFMGMRQEYAWRFSPPGARLVVHMESAENGDKLFDASLLLRRVEISGRSLAKALARHPWMTARVAAAIYWQALRLRLKGNPYHEHPGKRAA